MLHTSRTTAFDANNYAGLSYIIMNEGTSLMRYSCYGHPAKMVVCLRESSSEKTESDDELTN